MAEKLESVVISAQTFDAFITEQERKEKEQQSGQSTFRSSIVALGRDPRVKSLSPAPIPEVYILEIIEDLMRNPYASLKFRIQRNNLTVGKILGFEIYKRKAGSLDSYTAENLKNISAYDKISCGTKRAGKFSTDRKATNFIDESLMDVQSFNPNERIR